MAPNKSYGASARTTGARTTGARTSGVRSSGTMTSGAGPYRSNTSPERGRTRRATPIVYPESALTRSSTSHTQTRSRIGMQLLRDLAQTLPASPSRISPTTNGNVRRVRHRSRVEQNGPSELVLNRSVPMQSRTAFGGPVPMAVGIPVREVSGKDIPRRVRIRSQGKDAGERTFKNERASISMSNTSTARKIPMRTDSSLSQQYKRSSHSPQSPIVMVSAPAKLDKPVKKGDTVNQDIEQAAGLADENKSVASAPKPGEVKPVAGNEDKDETLQPEKVDPTATAGAGAEDKTEASAMSQPCMKIFPCFRGEYPTRNRPAPYQWFEQTGFNSGGPGTSSGNAGKENILTTCEVTEKTLLRDRRHPGTLQRSNRVDRPVCSSSPGVCPKASHLLCSATSQCTDAIPLITAAISVSRSTGAKSLATETFSTSLSAKAAVSMPAASAAAAAEMLHRAAASVPAAAVISPCGMLLYVSKGRCGTI
ncbi:uncharacterized protein [Drosophila pseudoobscura]|uniref:Uncharacterized protein isoform X2 n=1 Tax=Drosophila pseudoobscura pseudoobscura TaxID=46245 RepID=A0A6I8W5I8_DROPS|nr:uncharacterized protein LOC6900836 isoform X2 [Drosophila pseudoobscura]